MEATEQETIIVSQIEEDELETCHDPTETRIAYEWLMIEKSYKGQKWFIKGYLNKGKVLVHEEERSYWVYESNITVTLNDTRPIKLRDIQLWEVFNSQKPPCLVRLLKERRGRDEGVDIPYILRKLWKEVEEA